MWRSCFCCFLSKHFIAINNKKVLLRPGDALEEDGGVHVGRLPAGRAQDSYGVPAEDGQKDAWNDIQGGTEEGEMG